MIHAQTAFLVVGFLFVALPATAWAILHKRHDRASVGLWCGGGLLYGAGFILIGLREEIPAWLSFMVANPFMFAGYLLRGLALRRELGAPARASAPIGVFLLSSALYLAAYLSSSAEGPRLAVALVANLCGGLWLCRLAWQMYRDSGYRSAAMLAGAYGLFAMTLTVRLAAVLLSWNEARAMASTLDFAITFLASLVAALFGNLGYIGIALERSRGEELERGAALAREQEQRAQTELRVQEQATLLEERGRLLAEREEMLAALAHEVRQPLNNASAALQSAAQALAEGHHDREHASARLKRAKSVLTQVTSALDNTLTDAVLLGGTAPLARQDIDVDTLVSLAIGDVDPAARGRVQRERSTDTRTASMNAGLMRLALRNLIANALAYAPPESAVVVHVAESDEPLALLIDVRDQGSGIPPELLPRLFTRGARGNHVHNPRGHGLGLYIVRRIMEMHGGTAEVHPGTAPGLTLRLVIPQSLAA
jgi:signal transduction histidine kinase